MSYTELPLNQPPLWETKEGFDFNSLSYANQVSVVELEKLSKPTPHPLLPPEGGNSLPSRRLVNITPQRDDLDQWFEAQTGEYYSFHPGGSRRREQVEKYILELPLPNASVDVVHERFVLAGLSVPERHRAMTNFLRVIRKGGSMIAISEVWPKDSLYSPIEDCQGLISAVSQAGTYDPSYGNRSIFEWNNLLAETPGYEMSVEQFTCAKGDHRPELLDRLKLIINNQADKLDQTATANITHDFNVVARDLLSLPEIQPFALPDLMVVHIKRADRPVLELIDSRSA